MGAAAALYTVVFPLGDLLKAVGKQATIVGINIVLVPLMIAACMLAAPSGVLAVSWALVGTSAAFAGMMSLAVGRELHLRAGELAAAGLVRLTWPATSVPAVTVAAIAGALGAALALRLLAPGTFVDLVGQLRGLRPGPRHAPVRPV